MSIDPEIAAMSELYESLKGLDSAAVKRILDWTASKFEVTGLEQAVPPAPPAMVQPVPVPVTVPVTSAAPVFAQPVAPAPVPAAPVVEAPPAPEPIAETAAPAEPAPEDEPDEAPPAKPVAESKDLSTKGLGLKRYKTIENLFLAANINTVSSRILLAASYLQEKHNFEELSSYEINSRLKKMGYGVTNITNAINSLLRKKVPLMRQTKKEGGSKQSKRKFVVTEEGLQLAKTYLRSASE
ncbi:MAG: hypothetical protein GY940_29010 [bacterium]|nr:hypothetical protein [bacterium]